MNVYVELLRKICKDVREKLDKGHWGGKCRVSTGLPRLSVCVCVCGGWWTQKTCLPSTPYFHLGSFVLLSILSDFMAVVMRMFNK